jgi:hypothetical protein
MKNSPRSTFNLFFDLTLVLVLFLLANLASQHFQEPGQFNEGKGTDGVFYYQVAEQFSQGRLPYADAPFVYRIGTPFLAAALFPNDLLTGFKAINITFNLASALLLILWLYEFDLPRWVRLLLAAAFIAEWHGPVRYVYYYPVYTDPSLITFLLAGFYLVKKTGDRLTTGRIAALGVLVFLEVLFRESALLLPICLLFVGNPVNLEEGFLRRLARFRFSELVRPLPPLLLVPLLTGVLGWAAVNLLVTQANSYSYLEFARYWAYVKSFPSYLHGWFVTFGPLLFIAIFNWRRSLKFLAENQYLLVFLILNSILAWIGGSGTERLLYFGLPVVYLLIGKAIQDNLSLLKSIPLIVLLALSQAISERVFWTLPDLNAPSTTPFPILTPLTGHLNVLDLFSFYGNRSIEAISLLEYLALGAIVLWWLGYRRWEEAD